jgi:hypothetical protein
LGQEAQARLLHCGILASLQALVVIGVAGALYAAYPLQVSILGAGHFSIAPQKNLAG